MKIFGYTLPQLKKALVTASGFIVGIATAAVGLVPANLLPWFLFGIGVVTTIGVFAAKNAPSNTAVPSPEADVPVL